VTSCQGMFPLLFRTTPVTNQSPMEGLAWMDAVRSEKVSLRCHLELIDSASTIILKEE
jgi:hypothetical protein